MKISNVAVFLVVLTAVLVCRTAAAIIVSQGDAIIASQQDDGIRARLGTHYGQGVRTPGGGPWTNMSFHFDSGAGALTTAYAAGNLFVLTQGYTGTPAGLTAATPGFLGQSTGISNGAWTFASSVVLQPDTDYYFFMGGPVTTSTTIYVKDHGVASPPGLYYSTGPDAAYVSVDSRYDFAYVLRGDVVPEPNTLAIWSALGIAGIGLNRWRRRRGG